MKSVRVDDVSASGDVAGMCFGVVVEEGFHSWWVLKCGVGHRARSLVC